MTEEPAHTEPPRRVRDAADGTDMLRRLLSAGAALVVLGGAGAIAWARLATKDDAPQAVAAHNISTDAHRDMDMRLRALEAWQIQHDATTKADTWWIKATLRLMATGQGLTPPAEVHATEVPTIRPAPP